MREFLSRIDHILDERPLGAACLLLVLFCALLLFSPTALKIILFALCAAGGAALLFLRKRSRFARFHPVRAAVCLFVAALACLTCFLNYDLFDRRLEKAAAGGETARIVFYPDGVVYDGDYSALYTATVRQIDGKRVFGVKTLVAYETERPELFALYEGDCALSQPGGDSPYFDTLSYYRASGIFSQIGNGEDCARTGEEAYTPTRLFSYLRSAAAAHIDSFCEGNTAALLKALLLGDRSELPDSFKRDFRTMGVSHLLAISGLHLSILYFLLDRLLFRLFLPKTARSVTEILFLFFFCALCGFSPSVTRAGIMLILFSAASLFGEKSDGLTSLCFSGALIVLFSPFSVFNTAFQLSFFACFGILASANLRKKIFAGLRAKRLRRYLLEPLAVSAFAQLAVLPVILLTFGSFSPLAPVFSLILALPVTLILYLAPVCFFAAFIPFLKPVVSAAVTLPCNFTVWLSSFARRFKDLHIGSDLLPALLFCAVLAASLLLFFLHKRKLASLLAAAGFVLLTAYSFLSPLFAQPRLISTVDKHNDVLLFYGKGHSAIVDLSDGSSSYFDLCTGLLEEQTNELYPDTLILTHYHLRHLTSVSRLLQKTYLGELLLPKPGKADMEIYLSLVDMAQRSGVRTEVYSSENELRLSSGIVLSDLRAGMLKRSTHPVFCFTASRGETSVSFLSSSAWESFDVPTNGPLYFCVHGPIVRDPPDLSLFKGRAVFCPDKDLEKTLFGASEIDRAPPYVFFFG